MATQGGSAAPVFTITVGKAGFFTNDSERDVSANINAQIAAAPAGDHIVIDFEPGTYAESGPILLPSNTNVIGDDSTLEFLPGSTGNSALIANKDAYIVGNYATLTETNGSVTSIQIYNGTDTSDTQTMSNSNDIIDRNISVRGMTFAIGINHGFGTWFTNAENIDVQNNTYLNGVDANAFVDVVNSVAAQNIAVGQINGAYDNWNGPVNISIDNNSSYMSATKNTGWSVLINSTPSGNSSNPGNAVNDAIVGNQFASGYENALAIDANALTSYGPTSEAYITVQDNIDSMLGVVGQAMIYTASVMQGMLIEQNIISGLVSAAGGIGYLAAIGVYPNGSPESSADTSILGNLIAGPNAQSGQAILQNFSYNSTTSNNAVIAANSAAGAYPSGSGLGGTMTTTGNIVNYGSLTSGEGILPTFKLSAPGELLAASATAAYVPGLSISDSVPGDAVSMQLMVHFGTLSISDENVGATVTPTSSGGEYGLILTGSASQINQDLSALTFTSNAQGWDDSIGITVSNGAGATAVSFIPITVETTLASYGAPLTLSASYLASNGLGTLTNFGTLDGATLTGAAVIAESGNNTIAMGSSISLAFLGNGNNVVDGGSQDEYITTGAGAASLKLLQGGNVTVAGGTGTLLVDAATGNNLIEAGTGDATVLAGAGSNTIIGNEGKLDVTGGNGSLTIIMLPQGSGLLDAQLGPGNSVVYALSGTALISSSSSSSNLIVTGIGNTSIQSNGSDLIDLGAGDVKVNVLQGASDTIVGQLYNNAQITMATASSLTLSGIFGSSDDIGFNGLNNVLTIEDPVMFEGSYVKFFGGPVALNNIKSGDTIDLDGFTAKTETFISGIGLVLGDQGSNQITLDVTGSFSTRQFLLNSTPTGSVISVSNVTYSNPLTLSAAYTLINGIIAGAAQCAGGFRTAVYGKAASNYDVVVTGIVESTGTTQFDAGILLNGPGEISNKGVVQGGGAVIMLLDGGIIGNSGEITSSSGTAIESGGAGLRLTNVGQISAATTGVQVAGTANIVNTSDIIAGNDAVSVTGAASLYNLGFIESRNSVAVALLQGGQIGTAGTISASVGTAIESGGAGLCLTNVGQISAAGIGVQSTGNAFIDNTSNIIAGGDALSLAGTASIYNLGYIHSRNANAIVISQNGSIGTGGVIAAANGVAICANAGLRLDNTGVISATTTGVQIAGSASIYNSRNIIAGGDALSVAGTASIYNLGYIHSRNANAIVLSQNGSIGTGGVIAAGNGIAICDNAGLRLDNTGVISATTTGIQIGGIASIYNSRNIIAGGNALSVAGTASIYNLGYIHSRNANAIVLSQNGSIGTGGVIAAGNGIAICANAGLRLDNTGVISATTTGVQIAGSAYIYNSRNIISGGDGISDLNSLSIHNKGLIQSGTDTAIFASNGKVYNSGIIDGAMGVSLISGGSIDNTVTGTIAGTISASVGTAIESGSAGLRLTNVGQISAAGIGVQSTGNAYIDNTSNIIAGGDALSLAGTASIYNLGYIHSRNANAIVLSQNGSIGTGGVIAAGNGIAICANAGLRLDNTGVISATTTGVQIAGSAYIYNSRNIICGGDGISDLNSLSLHNKGLIQSGTDTAVFASNGKIYNSGIIDGAMGVSLISGGSIDNTVTGTIAGNVAVALSSGSTLDNSGLVIGGLAASAGSTIMNTGIIEASVNDNISLNGQIIGLGTIALGNGKTEIGGTVASGQQIAFTGGDETLSLTNPDSFSASLKNFTLTDVIDLTGIASTRVVSDNFTAGVLTLREVDGSITLTFANPGTLTGVNFGLFADGAGTGIILSPAPQMAFAAPAGTSAFAVSKGFAPASTVVYSPTSFAPIATHNSPSTWSGFQMLTPTSIVPLITHYHKSFITQLM